MPNARNPQFFGPQFEEMVARDRQRTQSLYGGMTADLRESLADAGLLASGALPGALVRGRVALGQQEAGSMASLYEGEYGRKGEFDVTKALKLMEQDYEDKKRKEDEENAWKALLFGTVGTAAKTFIPFI